jgi:molybdate transport system substrate-binding protein
MNEYFVLLSLLIVLTVTGCATPGTALVSTSDPSLVTSPDSQSTLPEATLANHTLTVFAAASLTGAFQEIGKKYETANPGVTVNFNFAGSQILRTQLEQGALADVFASADHTNMDLLVTDNLVAVNTYMDFATNQLIVILPPGNPGNVQALRDLAKPQLKLVLADASVPAGNYARQVLSMMSKDPKFGADFSSKVLNNVVSNETDVKQVVTKVELGEADAGIVYVSDAAAATDLATISIPENFNVTASYPIAILSSAPEPKLAAEFVGYVLSPAGQAVLGKWGFNPEMDQP